MRTDQCVQYCSLYHSANRSQVRYTVLRTDEKSSVAICTHNEEQWDFYAPTSSRPNICRINIDGQLKLGHPQLVHPVYTVQPTAMWRVGTGDLMARIIVGHQYDQRGQDLTTSTKACEVHPRAVGHLFKLLWNSYQAGNLKTSSLFSACQHLTGPVV